MTTQLKVNDLSYSYDGKNFVFYRLSFEASAGITVITGASGSGKTTLLKVLSGLEFPDYGKIFLNGEDITEQPPQKRKMAYIFQDGGLYPHLTVYQHVFMMCRDDRRAKELLEDCGIAKYVNCKPQHLSAGERQKLALAKCFASDARLYLMDEPMSALDTNSKNSFISYLKSWQRANNAMILYVSHNDEAAHGLADFVLQLPPL